MFKKRVEIFTLEEGNLLYHGFGNYGQVCGLLEKIQNLKHLYPYSKV